MRKVYGILLLLVVTGLLLAGCATDMAGKATEAALVKKECSPVGMIKCQDNVHMFRCTPKGLIKSKCETGTVCVANKGCVNESLIPASHNINGSFNESITVNVSEPVNETKALIVDEPANITELVNQTNETEA